MSQFSFKKFSYYLIIFFSYLIISLLYIHPAGLNFLNFDTSVFLSDGTDTLTSPYHFSYLIQLFKTEPSDFFFGAIPGKYLGIEETFPLWIPMIERIYSLLFGIILPPEQISTAIVIISMTLNGCLMFILSRIMAIPKLGSWTLGLAWAINAYTRARSKVHVGLVGIYFLPLLFISLFLIKKQRLNLLPLITICFLFCAFSPFYYVILMAVISPFLIYFLFLDTHHSWKKNISFLLLAMIPAVAWLCWTLLKPLPETYQSPHSMRIDSEQKLINKSFLDKFGAKTLDYFSGDVGLGPKDLNPLRSILNDHVYKNHFYNSNPHERSLGVRWIFWLFFLTSLVLLILKKNFFSVADKKLILFFSFFGLFCFGMSLSPSSFLEDWNLNHLINKLIPQFRVLNRIGIGVMFSLLMIGGILLKNFHNQIEKKLTIQILFLIITFLELPPFLQDQPLSYISQKANPLTEMDSCGVGLSIPYYSEKIDTVFYYRVLQQLRGSSCYIINSPKKTYNDIKLGNHFSWESINQRPSEIIIKRIKNFIECTRINWILFTFPLTYLEGQKMCHSLNWKWHNSGACMDPISLGKETIQRDKVDLTSCLNLMPYAPK